MTNPLHDTRAISDGDEPVNEILPGRVYATEDGEILIGVGTDAARMLVRLNGERLLRPEVGPLRLTGTIPAPAKTHDLSVRKPYGGTSIAVEGGTENRCVYLPAGVGQDLGRVLAVLTPTQIALLIGELTGGEK